MCGGTKGLCVTTHTRICLSFARRRTDAATILGSRSRIKCFTDSGHERTIGMRADHTGARGDKREWSVAQCVCVCVRARDPCVMEIIMMSHLAMHACVMCVHCSRVADDKVYRSDSDCVWSRREESSAPLCRFILFGGARPHRSAKKKLICAKRVWRRIKFEYVTPKGTQSARTREVYMHDSFMRGIVVLQ